MRHSRTFIPFFQKFAQENIRWPELNIPSAVRLDGPNIGFALTPIEFELAGAVFSPTYYAMAIGGQPKLFISDVFRHFITTGMHEARSPSPLFDPLVYKERSLLAGYDFPETEIPSFFHWMRHGMGRGIVPTAFFDEAYYQATYPDVTGIDTPPFVHFLRWGLAEGRGPNAGFDVAATQYAAATSKGTPWSILDAFIRVHRVEPDVSERPDGQQGETGRPSGYSLAWRWRAGVCLQQDMPVDPLRRYFEGINLDQGTVLTWSKLVASNWPLSEKSDALDFVAARVRSSNLFDADFYQEQAKLDPDLDPALHYVLVGEALGLLPSKDFNPGYYAQRNPDVMRTGMNLLLHYAEYGRAEGRYGHPPLTFHRNPARFDPARENVIVVVHETSRTGAPILGWNIVQHLAARYNVFTVRLGDGALTPAFEELSAETHGPFLRTQRHTVDIENGLKPLFAGRVFRYAIVNSSESRPLVEVCARHLVPTLFLMHEFGSYVHPASSLRRAFDWATEIVFSAPMVARASEEVHPVLRDRVNQVLPQGMSVVPPGNAPSKPLPVEKLAALASAREAGTFLVIGAGTVELRKGVDLFLAAAAAVRRSQPSRPVHFVWIGHGYRPDEDMGYSVYLKEQLQRSGLEEDVTFLGEVSDLEAVYSLADAFFLSSRLDPLPNVSIDAAHRGIPIICFEGASGTADLMLADPGTAPGVVPHLDADAAGRVIVHLASDAVACRQLAEATAQLARRIFDMAHYVDQLDALGATHVARAVRLRDDAAMLLTEGGFDPDFFQGPDSVLEERAETAALYLSRRRWDVSGARRPAPGFDPMAWAAAHPGLVADGVDPLAGFIRAGRPAGPWQSPVITPAESVTLSAERLQSVLHAHLPQAALAADLLTHLRPNALACDLLVTTDTEAKAADLRRALEAYGPGSVSVHVLPGDLLSVAGALGAKLADYDVVGHVHAGPGGAHDVWRDFQWQALLGGRHAMRDRILDAFAHMPSLGLVFPAEPHSPEWDDASHARVSTLVSRLGHTGPLPEVGGDFPVGGMVWMRGSVLQLLARLGPDGLSEGDIGRVLPVLNGMARLSHAVAHVPGVFW